MPSCWDGLSRAHRADAHGDAAASTMKYGMEYYEGGRFHPFDSDIAERIAKVSTHTSLFTIKLRNGREVMIDLSNLQQISRGSGFIRNIRYSYQRIIPFQDGIWERYSLRQDRWIAYEPVDQAHIKVLLNRLGPVFDLRLEGNYSVVFNMAAMTQTTKHDNSVCSIRLVPKPQNIGHLLVVRCVESPACDDHTIPYVLMKEAKYVWDPITGETDEASPGVISIPGGRPFLQDDIEGQVRIQASEQTGLKFTGSNDGQDPNYFSGTISDRGTSHTVYMLTDQDWSARCQVAYGGQNCQWVGTDSFSTDWSKHRWVPLDSIMRNPGNVRLNNRSYRVSSDTCKSIDEFLDCMNEKNDPRFDGYRSARLACSANQY